MLTDYGRMEGMGVLQVPGWGVPACREGLATPGTTNPD